MKPYLAKGWEVLGKLPVRLLFPLAILLVGGIGWLEYRSNIELSFSFLYLIPISLITWQKGWQEGLFLAGFCTAVGLVVGLVVGHSPELQFFLYWEAINRLIIFCITILLLSRLRHTLTVERTMAQTDSLTGLLNRRAFYRALSREIARAARHDHPATLVYVDLDAFKDVNDSQGHHAGDFLLEVVAKTFRQQVRAIDAVARLGGDEFALLLPETDEQAAQTVVPRLRQHLLAAMQEHKWPVTFSFGVLTYYQGSPSVDDLMKLADRLMYSVKRGTKDDIAYATIKDGRFMEIKTLDPPSKIE